MWAGLWEFPGLVLPGDADAVPAITEEARRLIGLDVTVSKLARIEHHHTRYRVLLDGYFCRLAVAPDGTSAGCRWVRIEELAAYALSAGHRRLAGVIPDHPQRFRALDAGA
ncbi:MAG TPA: hypothetical protein DEB25_06940 [Desulfobulbaceae bacterium]|nr:hypothetical protein [Desulfobulbaceae bacterium]